MNGGGLPDTSSDNRALRSEERDARADDIEEACSAACEETEDAMLDADELESDDLAQAFCERKRKPKKGSGNELCMLGCRVVFDTWLTCIRV